MLNDNMAHLQNQVMRLSDLKTKYIQNVPFSKIHIDNYRKTKPLTYLMELGTSIESNGLFQAPGLIDLENGEYELIFGQCRVIACDKYTSLESLPEAKIWPKTATKFKKTIAYIENREREDPPLDEEVAGIKDAIISEYTEFDNPRKAFCEQTGYTDNEISMKLKIADGMEANERFKEIVAKQIIGDYKTLYDVAQALTIEASPARKKYVDQLIDLLLSGKLAGSVRDAASQVKKHVKSGGAKPELSSTDEDNPPAPHGTVTTKPKRRVFTARQIQDISERLDGSDIKPEQETLEAIQSLIQKLQNILNETVVSKADSH